MASVEGARHLIVCAGEMNTHDVEADHGYYTEKTHGRIEHIAGILRKAVNLPIVSPRHGQ